MTGLEFQHKGRVPNDLTHLFIDALRSSLVGAVTCNCELKISTNKNKCAVIVRHLSTLVQAVEAVNYYSTPTPPSISLSPHFFFSLASLLLLHRHIDRDLK